MASYAYDEDIDPLASQDELVSATDITECDDGRQLEAWLDSFEVRSDSIRAQLDAARRIGRDDDAWVYRASRALGFLGIGCGRIRRRMREIGWQSRSQEGAIQELQRKLQTTKAEAAYGRAFIGLANQQLPAHEFARIDAEALALIEPK